VATIVNIDVMLAKRKMSVTELAERVGITLANLSILKNGKARAIRFSTLEGICRALDCQPGDLLEYRPDDTPDTPMTAPSRAPADAVPSPV
jgi:putative transcriptional regulator